MTPKIQDALFALAQGARKSLTPDLIETYLGTITNEVQDLQERAKVHDGLSELIGAYPNPTPKNLSGNEHLTPIKFLGSLRIPLEDLAEGHEAKAKRAIECAGLMALAGFPQYAALEMEVAEQNKKWAERYRIFAKEITT